MKKLILCLTIFAVTFTTLIVTKPTNAAWSHDGFGYISNICKNGVYWQVVPWNYVGTSCFMPGWNSWGRRVAE